MNELKLVVPSLEYKSDALEFLKEVKEVDVNLPWAFAGMSRMQFINEDYTYEEWIQDKIKESNGIDLKENHVPGSTYFLVRLDDNKIVGCINIRHALNDYLLKYGGHVGQTVRPTERGKGYGKLQLEKALEKCLELGIDKVLVTCDERNIISKKTIEACFGEYENSSEENDKVFLRYWISPERLKEKER